MGLTPRPPRVRVQVGELALPQLPSADPRGTAERVRTSLSRLLTDEGTGIGPEGHGANENRARIQVPASPTAPVLGDAIARALYRILRRG